ncbi:MAG: hypothetical protein M3O31_12255 [Acidobacteriota bacterium]|nr:hypothetical protein [Acidobacteriota bacterium]
MLKLTRAKILQVAGYEVAAVETHEEAVMRLEAERFDLVLVGIKDRHEAKGVDAEVRDRHPSLPILKIASFPDQLEANQQPTWITDSVPHNVVKAVRELIGD